MELSPFSLQHDWTVNWSRIPSNVKVPSRYNINSMKERKALEALASVGVIGKKQLSRLFQMNKTDIKNLENSHKIVRHNLKQNNNGIIPIYTLGINGARAINLEVYDVNYWVEYFASDVLKRLLFFQVYNFFPTLRVVPSPEPFISAVQNNNNLIYVYVLKGDVNDLMRFLKWKKMNHRLILVTEKFEQLKPLELAMDDLKVRVVLEKDLMTEENFNQDIFYYYKDGALVR